MAVNDLHEGYETLAQMNNIHWNSIDHTIIIEDKAIELTTTEFQLLYPLRNGLPVTYTNLAYSVYHCEMDNKVRVMLDKHIDRIRGKLRGTGLYIYCVLGYGYMLFPKISQSNTQDK